MLKKIKCNVYCFALLFSILNLVLYYKPLLDFVVSNLNISSFDGKIILIEIIIAELFLGYLFIVLISFIPFITKPIVIIVFICNSVALYFELKYNAILDKTMMGNVFNTNTQETFNLYSYKLILFIIFLGILPSLFILKIKIVKKFLLKKLFLFTVVPLLIILGFFYVNSSTWLWIDKNLKVIAALSPPFSYSINAMRYKIPLLISDSKEYQLPNSSFTKNKKSVVILVIGESARANNFSLYGYKRNTNPSLKNQKNLIVFPNTTSCATYTTAGVKCILSYNNSSSYSFKKNYEYLPTYLKRHGIKVFWRTANWGEPKIKVDLYQKTGDIRKQCKSEDCKTNDYDGVLLYNLNDIIKENIKNNIFIVLHTSGSHGPTYYKKYPNKFKKFTPVCESVEIKEHCNESNLINAYDNTIVYTDYVLTSVINILKSFNVPSTMIYISDHGESLGENNKYLHGLPNFMAPKYQRDIPFIVWVSDEFKKLYNININKMAKKSSYSQDNIFYSVMGAFGMKSNFYNNKLDIFNTNK